MAMKPKSAYSVPAEKFVCIWQKSASAAEVAEKLGCARRSCSSLAQNMRKRGVPLKLFKSQRHKHDYTALAALAKKSLK